MTRDDAERLKLLIDGIVDGETRTDALAKEFFSLLLTRPEEAEEALFNEATRRDSKARWESWRRFVRSAMKNVPASDVMAIVCDGDWKGNEVEFLLDVIDAEKSIEAVTRCTQPFVDALRSLDDMMSDVGGAVAETHGDGADVSWLLTDSERRLSAALKEALDMAERFAVQVEEETHFADGGSETKRRIAEMRNEFGL